MKLLFLVPLLLLTACNEYESISPVKDAPEIHTQNSKETAKVTFMPDGSRFVVITQYRSTNTQTTIILPPLKEQPIEANRNKEIKHGN
jgi:hypothetical protein